MKKLIFGIFMALACAMGASAAETQYKVYDVVMTVKTTTARGVTETNCGSEYVFRDRATRRIRGVIGGCGCEAAFADPTCDNFVSYFWDETTKTVLTNLTFETKILQRVGKRGTVVEHYVVVTSEQDGETFSFVLVGMGTYVARADSKYDRFSASGNVTGLMDAPHYVVRGKCRACVSTPDYIKQSMAVSVCEDGVCYESVDSGTTVAYGTYSMTYNSGKSNRCENRGVTPDALGIPAYAR